MSDRGHADIAPETMIEALRATGADRFDPVGFCFIEAMARRTVARRDGVKAILTAKLANALLAYNERFEQARTRAGDAVAPATQGRPLADLLAYIQQHAPEASNDMPADRIPRREEAAGELKSLAYFRSTWSKLSVDHELAQALAQAPENAGPLNSHHLVLQSLKQMRDISPDYLKRFMSYVDALFWLEQADSGRSPVQRSSPGGEPEKKRKSGRQNSR